MLLERFSHDLVKTDASTLLRFIRESLRPQRSTMRFTIRSYWQSLTYYKSGNISSKGAQHPVTVYTNHKNLEYFMSAKVLNRRQARWSILLSRFNFIIIYRPGTQQIRSNALSRRAYLAPKEGDAAYDQQQSILLKPKQLQLRTTHITTSMDVAFPQDIRVSLQSDPLALKFKSHSDSYNSGEIQTLDSQIPDSMVIDSESTNQTISSLRIYRSQGGKMPQDDIDSRFQFCNRTTLCSERPMSTLSASVSTKFSIGGTF